MNAGPRMMMLLVLATLLGFCVWVQPIRAGETIYIRADGSVEPLSAPITQDGSVYSLTANVTEQQIVIEKANMTFDGAGFDINGTAGVGVEILEADNVTLRNCILRGFARGICFNGSSNSNILRCKIQGSLASWIGVLSYRSPGLTISNSTIIAQNGSCHSGVSLSFDSGSSKILYNNISGSLEFVSFTAAGVELFSSSNLVLNNRFRYAWTGISCEFPAVNNSIRGNVFEYGSDVGVISSGNATIVENEFVDSVILIAGGMIYPNASQNSEVARNTFAPGTINVVRSSNNLIANNSIDIRLSEGLVLVTAQNNKITSNTISGYGDGIKIEGSSYNNITGNTIQATNGILLSNFTGAVSTGNYITENNVTGGLHAIDFDSICPGNIIYHNNFEGERSPQVIGSIGPETWDNGYPSGGNFWSHYNGTDLYSGPYQNVTGSDGMGDTPYIIGPSADNYPLMTQYVIPELRSFLPIMFVIVTTLAVVALCKERRRFRFC